MGPGPNPLTVDRSPFTVLIAGGGTGGHLMPALAIAGALRRAHPDWRIVLAGATRGVEAKLLPTREFPYHLLAAEPIYRRQWWKNLRWPLLALRLIREVDRLLDLERPRVVVGTGGYVAGPVVWRAARRGLPTAIQEQNAYPGVATRRLARVAREIWLGVPEARSHLRPGPHTEVVETGSPIVPPDPGLRAEAMARFALDPGRPVVLVTGGSQGAQALNEAVAGWIGGGPGAGVEPQIIWATGRGTYERFRSHHHPPGVQVFDFLDPMACAYAVADLAISRAGMMTLSELCAWGIPSILVPLPSAAADHQTPNARVLAEAGAAIHLPQSELTPGRLRELVAGVLQDPDRRARMAAAARSRGHPDAADRIATRIGLLSG
jgi:UDP-N-acetylglucosamine--N-acetylmuramyl-(pentapeptide) pyrophosphoryl-undecaprenol N-acetylglucosamine transferase